MSAAAAPSPAHSPTTANLWQASGRHGAVAAFGPDATRIGLEALRSGGNAIDAAVAMLLALTVTESDYFCFGGEVPIMIYNARRGGVEVIAGMGAAPRLATLDKIRALGGFQPDSIISAAVPAALDALITSLERHGTRTFAESARPTLELLDRHAKPWHADLARTLRRVVAAEAASPADRLRGLRLAADCFYRGPIAHEFDAWSRANGGLLRYADLATHVTRVEDPVSLDYRGHTIYKCGPWTQGPFLLQTLSLLEGFNLAAMGQGSADSIHLCVEAMKLGLADRDDYLADPLFEDVPLQSLLSADYAAVRRPLIDMTKASFERRPGDSRALKPRRAPGESITGPVVPLKDTTNCVAADRWGNVVAATPSGWGGVLAGSTGVWLGSRLRSFNTWPGHPNCVEPGKRPRITLTPTLVLKDSRPVMSISVAGGDLQDQVALQMLVNHIDFKMDAAASINAPRFGTNHFIGSFGQEAPKLGAFFCNKTVGPEALDELKRRGHTVAFDTPPLAHVCMLTLDPATGLIHAVGEPLSGRHARAY